MSRLLDALERAERGRMRKISDRMTLWDVIVIAVATVVLVPLAFVIGACGMICVGVMRWLTNTERTKDDE